MAATVQQISEGALERALNQLVQASPEEAVEIRGYFDENREFFLRLGWAVVNRLVERWAPRQAAEEAVKRLQAALVQAEPADTSALEKWFRENEPTLVGVALGLARDAAPHLVAHPQSGLSLLLLFAGAGERPWLRFLARYLPPAVMTVLVLYCLKDAFAGRATGPWPVLAGVVVTVAVHVARRNAL